MHGDGKLIIEMKNKLNKRLYNDFKLGLTKFFMVLAVKMPFFVFNNRKTSHETYLR